MITTEKPLVIRNNLVQSPHSDEPTGSSLNNRNDQPKKKHQVIVYFNQKVYQLLIRKHTEVYYFLYGKSLLKPSHSLGFYFTHLKELTTNQDLNQVYIKELVPQSILEAYLEYLDSLTLLGCEIQIFDEPLATIKSRNSDLEVAGSEGIRSGYKSSSYKQFLSAQDQSNQTVAAVGSQQKNRAQKDNKSLQKPRVVQKRAQTRNSEQYWKQISMSSSIFDEEDEQCDNKEPKSINKIQQTGQDLDADSFLKIGLYQNAEQPRDEKQEQFKSYYYKDKGKIRVKKIQTSSNKPQKIQSIVFQ